MFFQGTRRQVLRSEETVCGDYIESKYYNHLGGKKENNSSKGDILVTGDICAM